MTKTTSYEISKKLEEAGFSRQPFWIWTSEQCCAPYQTNYDGFRSYDLETILDALKQTGKRIMIVVKNDNWGINFDYEFNKYSQENESLADTAGRMWLMLKEKGIIC